jgi:hypothetical protein
MLSLAALVLALGARDVPVLPPRAEVVDRTEEALYAADKNTLYAYDYAVGEWREVRTDEGWIGSVRVTRAGVPVRLHRDLPPVDGAQFEFRRLVRTAEVWFACGWTGTPPWGEGSLKPNHQVYVGEGMQGVVLASADEGVSWSVLERWPGGAIEDVWLTAGDDLVVLRAGGGIRRGALRLVDGTPAVELKQLVDPSSFEITRPAPDYGNRLLFPAEGHGFVVGAMFYEGPAMWESKDAGATWKETVAVFELDASGFMSRNTYLGALQLDSGRWVAVTRTGPQTWNGEAFENWGPRSRFLFDAVFHGSRGELLVVLENHQVWAFDRTGEWTPVAILPGQTFESPWKDE